MRILRHPFLRARVAEPSGSLVRWTFTLACLATGCTSGNAPAGSMEGDPATPERTGEQTKDRVADEQEATGSNDAGAGSRPPRDAAAPRVADAAAANTDAGREASSARIDGGDEGSSPDGGAAPQALREVVMVGNSVAGTVSFVDAHSFESLGSVNVIPDFDDVMFELTVNPVRAIGYQVVKSQQLLHHFEPQGGDRFVDDLFVSPDGMVLYVSRSNLGDVAAIDLSRPEHPVLWRTYVDGFKADHAAISPDGKRIAVSATSAQVTDVLDTATGKLIGTFPTGYYPHQNDYSPDGKHIYNSSIGNVGYQAVSYQDNALKGNRWLVKADAETMEIVDTWEFEWGIRPNIFTPDETVLYTQLSYLNGVVKYDLLNKKELARNEQPLSAFALETYATYDEYPHDSAHHGLALSGDGARLCDCGTVDNTVAILRTEDMSLETILDVGMVPYWASTSPDGKHCLVSMSGDDTLSVISFETGQQVVVVPVGDFPQRNRLGTVPQRVIDLLDPSPG